MSDKYSIRTHYGSVRVEAPARLHLGFMDLNGSTGRHFGSLGITLDGISTDIEVRQCRSLQVEGPESTQLRALSCAASLIKTLGLPEGVCINIHNAIPDHVGLGSGTQLALAIATGLSRLYGVSVPTRRLASLMNRGLRSGIGVGSFDTGGFILDGGRGSANVPPPVIMQTSFPEDWRLLLIFDERGPGIHGTEEIEAFKTLPLFPEEQAAALCRIVMMQALPALIEQDCDKFGSAIGYLQEVIGDHFSPAQAGRFASPYVAQVLHWVKEQNIHGIGQSSWGPTGFVILDCQSAADKLLHRIKARFGGNSDLRFMLCGGRNHGCNIQTSQKKSSSHTALRAAM